MMIRRKVLNENSVDRLDASDVSRLHCAYIFNIAKISTFFPPNTARLFTINKSDLISSKGAVVFGAKRSNHVDNRQ